MTALLAHWMKWPDTPYRTTPMTRLGDDDLGTWLFAPKGAPATYAAVGDAPLPTNFLTLLPAGRRWWVATWMWGNPAVDIELYVDIVHPPSWSDESLVRIVDLDLDVVRRRDGTVVIDDEDEFDEHTTSLGYPAHVTGAARRAADEVFAAVSAHAPPFASPPASWLVAVGRPGAVGP